MSITPSGESENVELVVGFEAGRQKAPVALQFEIQLSARQFVLERWVYAPGSAAESAGKTVQCGGRWAKNAGIYIYTCIVSGKTNEIADGPIFRATVPRSSNGKHNGKILIENANAVDSDGKSYSIKKTEWSYR